MNEHWITQNKARLFLHLSNSGLQRRLISFDGACHEVVPIRVLAGDDCAGTKLVSEHDLIAARVMAEHGDRIAALHHFPRDPPDPSAVFLDVEFILIYLKKSLVQGCSRVDDCSQLSYCHFQPHHRSRVRTWLGSTERERRVCAMEVIDLYL